MNSQRARESRKTISRGGCGQLTWLAAQPNALAASTAALLLPPRLCRWRRNKQMRRDPGAPRLLYLDRFLTARESGELPTTVRW